MANPSLTSAAALNTGHAGATAVPAASAGETPAGAFAALLDALAQPQALLPALPGAAAGPAETAAAHEATETAAASETPETELPWLGGLPDAVPQAFELLSEPVPAAAAPVPVPVLPPALAEGQATPAVSLVDMTAPALPREAPQAKAAQPPALPDAGIPGPLLRLDDTGSTVRLAAPPAAIAAQAEPAPAREAPGRADGSVPPATISLAHEPAGVGERPPPGSLTPAADSSAAPAADSSAAPAAGHGSVPNAPVPAPSAPAGPVLHSAQAGPSFQTAAPAAHEAVHQAALSSRPLDHAFGGDLAAEVRLMVASGMQRAELRLNPTDLGPIHIQLSVNSQTADISFAASHGTTREGISVALPALREMLASQGLSLGQADVSSQHPGQSPADARPFSMRAPTVHEGTGAAPALAAAASGALRPGRGMLDLYA